ncbi:hypothetical protein PoB_000792700 [Plakobranchus ocellatus]|uniref:Uncharacterized protein n=1 Tax=Plakobranchus ocellatus TaxID=259542 RepID=A0AAV3YF06_9GAST|nr:hypothetical protein PoB_000792700 [Plakobranchus ocellatus]
MFEWGVEHSLEKVINFPFRFTMDSEPALRSAGTLLSQVRTPPPAPWPDGGLESLRSHYCELAIHANQSIKTGDEACKVKAVEMFRKRNRTQYCRPEAQNFSPS